MTNHQVFNAFSHEPASPKSNHEFIFYFFHNKVVFSTLTHMQLLPLRNDQLRMYDFVCIILMEPCSQESHLYLLSY